MNKASLSCFPLMLLFTCTASLFFGVSFSTSRMPAVEPPVMMVTSVVVTEVPLATPSLTWTPPPIPQSQIATAQAQLQTRTSPIDILFVVDISGSMTRDNRLSAAVSALHSFANSLLPEDNVGLITFNDSVDVLVPLGTFVDSESDFRAALDSLYPDSDTELYAGVEQAFELMTENGNPDRLRVIILISDGADTGSSGTTLNDAVTAISDSQSQGSRIFFIVIAYGLDADFQALNTLAQAANVMPISTSPTQINTFLLLIGAEISRQAEMLAAN